MLDFLSQHQTDIMCFFQHKVVVPHVGKLPLGTLFHAPFRHRLVIVATSFTSLHTPETALFFRVILETEFTTESHTLHNIPGHGPHRIERLVDSLFIISFRFFFGIKKSFLFQLIGIEIRIVFGKFHIFIQTLSRFLTQSRQQTDAFRTGSIYFLMQQTSAVFQCQEFKRFEVERSVHIILFQSVAYHHTRLVLMDKG